MADTENFVLTGDHRDIPMALGLICIAWNSCELGLRQMLRSLVCAGEYRSWKAAEILIVEMNSVGIAQALDCMAEEFADEQSDLRDAIKFAVNYLTRARQYRNYYVHGIRGVTGLGFSLTDEDIENDTPVWELMKEGPFGHVYHKSAKHKSRFTNDFINSDALTSFSNSLANFNDYIRALEISVNHYFRGEPYPETAPVPSAPSLLSPLVKPENKHPKLRSAPAFRLYNPIRDDDDVEAD
ncbi:hypothetical protein [Sphingomonas sp. NFR15]|uniref:hypothetical protein n=1 Tax=Sphingomonas sp. NFR15 TaxID=1566282 RepID=UPI00088FE413|nr:hypothetical protein [Sphingomonas sp. NFR15]SDA14509.1 hypothetical protein SAMN03159340_00559 [Sphingomonas sp. NFR15]